MNLKYKLNIKLKDGRILVVEGNTALLFWKYFCFAVATVFFWRFCKINHIQWTIGSVIVFMYFIVAYSLYVSFSERINLFLKQVSQSYEETGDIPESIKKLWL